MSQSRPSEFVRRTVALPGTGAGTTATSQPAHNRARAGPQARGCGAKTPPPPNRERARARTGGCACPRASHLCGLGAGVWAWAKGHPPAFEFPAGPAWAPAPFACQPGQPAWPHTHGGRRPATSAARLSADRRGQPSTGQQARGLHPLPQGSSRVHTKCTHTCLTYSHTAYAPWGTCLAQMELRTYQVHHMHFASNDIYRSSPPEACQLSAGCIISWIS